MKCTEYKELFSAYIDDVLNEKDRQLVEIHIRECHECRQELEDLKFTVQLVRNMSEESAPNDLVASVIDKLKCEEVGSESKSAKGFKYWGLNKFVAAASILVVVMGLGILSLDNLRVGTDSAKQEYSTAQDSEMISVASNEAGEITGFSAVPEGQAKVLQNEANTDEKQKISKAGVYGNERKVIKNATMDLEVSNLNQAYDEIINKTEALGGYIENSAINNRTSPEGEIIPSYSEVVARIPVNSLQSFVNFVEQQGKVIHKQSSGQDVTTEYYDLQTRITNFKNQEVRLREILDKAKNVEEVLKIETELHRVRGEIEVMEGKIKYLSNVTDLATVNIHLNQVRDKTAIQTPEVKSVWQRAREGFVDSANDLLRGIGELFIGIGEALPYLIMLVLGTGLVVIILKLRKK